MAYISIKYYLLVLIMLTLYYLFPVKYRWTTLLAGNLAFYYYFFKDGFWILMLSIVVSYLLGLMLKAVEGASKNVRKSLLIISILIVIIPWFLVKESNFIIRDILAREPIAWIIPVGISFYTLQVVAYLVDIYTGKIEAEVNPAKYALFISYFPQIVQGPIPRFGQLEHQLVQGHRFDENKVIKGFYYIIWGFFLKLVIADKAAVIVNQVFDNYAAYTGVYLWVAGILYSVQLYADFLACTTLAQGVSLMFGIQLIDNFARPYFAVSIQDFWKRWHMSLSSWLRDYIYIPLGGNRKGVVRKYINILVTFFVSGIWHGAGFNFLFWGILHAIYQIVGTLTNSFREGIYTKLHIENDSKIKRQIKQVGTFVLVTWAWVIFRADSLRIGLSMIYWMLRDINPWVIFSTKLFKLGLKWQEFIVLVLAIGLMHKVGVVHEKGDSVSEKIMSLWLPVRWTILILAIIGIMIFGTYGYGFNAQDFIYGGF